MRHNVIFLFGENKWKVLFSQENVVYFFIVKMWCGHSIFLYLFTQPLLLPLDTYYTAWHHLYLIFIVLFRNNSFPFPLFSLFRILPRNNKNDPFLFPTIFVSLLFCYYPAKITFLFFPSTGNSISLQDIPQSVIRIRREKELRQIKEEIEYLRTIAQQEREKAKAYEGPGKYLLLDKKDPFSLNMY